MRENQSTELQWDSPNYFHNIQMPQKLLKIGMGEEPKFYKCMFINIFPPVIWENLAVLQLDLSQSRGTSVFRLA